MEHTSNTPTGSCPICQNTALKSFLTCKDYTVSKEDFTIVQCKTCGFRFTDPRPRESEIGKYYQSSEYISHSNSTRGLMGWMYKRVRNITLKQKVKLVKSQMKGNLLLDIGCGTGFFLNRAQASGLKVLGLEPDENARKFAIENNQVEVKPIEALYQLDQKFDCITMWHVLEHVYHLRKDAERICSMVKENGTLIVAVPNCDSFDAGYYQEKWAGYDVPRHLYHFVENDIRSLFSQFGFELSQVLPMKYDAFYVSMLSEKNSGDGMRKGILVGKKSNSSANAGKTPWSSQIYVLKHKKQP